MKKATKIVCTIGPSSDYEKTLKKMYEAGMNVARLNCSHSNYEYMHDIITKVRGLNDHIAIMMDLKGPEIRTGELSDEIELEEGQEIEFTNEPIEGDNKQITINYDKLQTVEKGSKILIDDGLIECDVISQTKNGVRANVINAGILGSKKTVTIWGHDVDLPFLSQKDKEDIEFAIKNDVSFIAASFVREASEVNEIRNMLSEHNSKTKIISKIEHARGVKNFDKILEASDGIMIARGDLGVEMPLEKVPYLQRDMIRKCRLAGKPVIVATQMLESMKSSPRPTRAEVSDVAQAIVQGTDAVMLSGETASGKYPVKSIRVMAKIAKEYEHNLISHLEKEARAKQDNEISLFITEAAYEASESLKTKAILVPTESGFTARHVSKFRPGCPIYTSSRDQVIVRQLQLSWGVIPFHYKITHKYRDNMINSLVTKVYNENHIDTDDRIVVTAGFKLAKEGYTNLIEIYNVKDIIGRIENNEIKPTNE